MDDLSRFCCPNPECPAYGQRAADNLRVAFSYGPQPRRVLACRRCQHRFSERTGTALFDGRLPEDKALAVLHHLAEGCGIRATARLVGVNKNTVVRLAALAGDHARQLHDELVAFSPPDPRGATRREVVVRGQEGEALRPHRPRRR
jgi:transposase-like protein